MRIRQVLLPKDDYVRFDLELLVLRSFSPTVQMVQGSLRASLGKLLQAKRNAVYIDGTQIKVDAQMVKNIVVIGELYIMYC